MGKRDWLMLGLALVTLAVLLNGALDRIARPDARELDGLPERIGQIERRMDTMDRAMAKHFAETNPPSIS
jgi:hypothetical protein